MKRRRNLLVVLLALCTLCVGVGYAALTTTLTITGSATVDAEILEFVNNVVFTDATSSNDNLGTAKVETDTQYASFEVFGLTRENESVVFTYTITNNSTGAVDIAKADTTYATEWFRVEQELVGADAGTVRVDATKTATVKVTVTLLKEATEEVSFSDYTVSYVATAVTP